MWISFLYFFLFFSYPIFFSSCCVWLESSYMACKHLRNEEKKKLILSLFFQRGNKIVYLASYIAHSLQVLWDGSCIIEIFSRSCHRWVVIFHYSTLILIIIIINIISLSHHHYLFSTSQANARTAKITTAKTKNKCNKQNNINNKRTTATITK